LVAEQGVSAEEASARFAAATAESERISTEKRAVVDLTVEKLSAIRAEEIRLAAEKSATEREAAEKLALVMAEEERLTAEKYAAEKEAAEKLAAVLAEEEILAAVALAPSPTLPETSETAVLPAFQPKLLSCEFDPNDPFVFLGVVGASHTASSESGSAPTPMLFHVDKTLRMVEYNDPADIIELYTPLNVARVTPDGRNPENSCAFICALGKNDSLRVYLPFLFAESGRILVYVPERQPENQAELSAIIGNAVEYIEAVGFIMDPALLPADGQARAAILDGIPVLSRVSKEARKASLAA